MVLRFLILAFAVLWVGRRHRPVRPHVSAARPAVDPAAPDPPRSPEPRDDRLIGVLRLVVGAVLVIVFSLVLFALTDLPELVTLLIAAPLAGLASSSRHRVVRPEDDD